VQGLDSPYFAFKVIEIGAEWCGRHLAILSKTLNTIYGELRQCTEKRFSLSYPGEVHWNNWRLGIEVFLKREPLILIIDPLILKNYSDGEKFYRVPRKLLQIIVFSKDINSILTSLALPFFHEKVKWLYRQNWIDKEIKRYRKWDQQFS